MYNPCLGPVHKHLSLPIPHLHIPLIFLSVPYDDHTLPTRHLPLFVNNPVNFLARPYLTNTDTGSSTAMPEILGKEIGPIGYGLLGKCI